LFQALPVNTAEYRLIDRDGTNTEAAKKSYKSHHDSQCS